MVSRTPLLYPAVDTPHSPTPRFLETAMICDQTSAMISPSIRGSIAFAISVLIAWGPSCCLAETKVGTKTATWSQWRGNHQDGVVDGDALGPSFPISWSEEDSIAWKTAIPGRGSSTPVVDGDVAYFTSGVDDKNMLIAMSLTEGKILWKTPLGHDVGNKHKKGSGSNPSAAVRDGLVYAYFRSGDLACVDRDGEIVWQMNLQEKFGKDTLWWDLGSSPIWTKTSLIVAVVQTGPSYLVALDPKTGELQWKEDRNVGAPKEAAQTYASPLALSSNGKDLIAMMGADHLTLHDALTGKTLGKLGGFNPTENEYFRSISSPVAIGDLIVCPYARGETLTGVRISALLEGKGKSSIAWHRDDLGSDVPTPAASKGKVYLVSDAKQTRGQVFAIDIETGETLWNVKTPKSRIGFSSSPLVAGDHLYVTAENGTTHVIGPLSGNEPKLVSTNVLSDDEPFTTASPVPYDGSLLIRTKNSLYRIK